MFLANFIGVVHASVVTVQHIHSKILSEEGILLPIETGANASSISGLNYLMRQIDAANAVFGHTTNYAANTNTNVVDGDRALHDIQSLITPPPEFTVHLTVTGNYAYTIEIIAAGNFEINWGDGSEVQTISKTNIGVTQYTHRYALAGDYNINLSGDATEYTVNAGAIRFCNYNYYNTLAKVTAVSGSLGDIFPTLGNTEGQQSSFYGTFSGCTGLTSIPAGLFDGVNGVAVRNMFNNTFRDCTGLTSIPTGLFDGINDVSSATYVFQDTFRNCTGLTSIPTGLFGTFTGSLDYGTFYNTFNGCTNVTTIEDGIWDLSNTTSAKGNGFRETFAGMTSLTSASPKIAPGSNVELWEHFTNYTGQNAFSGNTKMLNYADIPTAWK